MTTGSAGALAARLALDTSGFTASMQAAGALSEKELGRIRRQVQFATDYIKEMGRQQRAVNDSANMSRSATEIARVGQAAELSAKQLSRAKQMLPAQMTDIFTSLASGQQPWLVLLQQGGQIKDMFGGIGNAMRVMAASITPASLALTAVGVAVGLVGGGFFAGMKESERFRDAVTLSGNAAGMTADRFNQMADRIAATSAQTVGGAKEIGFALVQSGRSAFGAIESQALAAARIADLSGEAGEKVAAKFADQLKAPAKFAAELNERYNFLNITQFRRIQLLDQENKKVDAAVLTNNLLVESLKGQRENLGFLESALETVSKKWSDFWNAAKGVGRDQGVLEMLAERRKEIQKILDASEGKEPRAGSMAAGKIGSLRTQAMLLAEKAKQEQGAAEATAKAAEASKKAIESSLKKQKPVKDEPWELKGYDRVMAAEYKAYAEDRMASDEAARKMAEQAESNRWESEKRNAVAMFKRDSEEMVRAEADAKKLIAEQAKFGEQQVQLFEDRLMNLVKNGKAGFGDLFSTMAEEFIRNTIRMVAQKALLNDSGGFVGWGQGLSNMASMFGFGGTSHAQGLDYVPYDGYPAILHKGERVQTAVEAGSTRSAGQTQHFDFSGQTLQVGQGVSRAEMDAVVSRRNQELELRMRRLSREGVFG